MTNPKRVPAGRVWRGVIDRLPPEDRVWGEALLAEAEFLAGRRRLAWLGGLVAVWIGRGQGHQRRTAGPSPAGRGLGLGLTLGAVLAVGIVATNLWPLGGHPTSDSGAGSAAGFLAVAAALVLVGFVNRGHLSSSRACAAATAITGLVAFLISMATFLVIDNVFLSTVAQQPDKIYGLAHSHYHTMRSYINADLARGSAFMIPVTLLGAAVLGAVGAALHGPRQRRFRG